MINSIRKMKDIKKILEKVEGLDSRVYDGLGMLAQFTIDIVENTRSDLHGQITSTAKIVSDDDCIGSLLYDAETVHEVMDKMIPDYAVVAELIDILKSED